MDMVKKLVNYFKAGYPCLAILTTEEKRVQGDILTASKQADKDVATWSAAEGIVYVETAQSVSDTEDLLAALRSIQTANKEDIIYILRDAHQWPFDRDPIMARFLREVITEAPARGCCIVLISPDFKPLSSVEKLVTMIEYSLPDYDDLREIAKNIAEGIKKKIKKAGDDVIKALSGLSTTEAENALALSVIEKGEFSPEIIYREKVAAVKRSGLLEIVDPDPRGLDAIGGCENLKEWIIKRNKAYSAEAEKYGLPAPKGVLLVGVPGCLAGDTKLLYQRGRRVSGREISLKDFYCKFNDIPTSSNGWLDTNAPTFLHSLDTEDGTVFYNRVVAVWESGVKKLIKITFDDGTVLRCTKSHPIAIDNMSFIEAGKLSVGSVVLCRGSMRPQFQGGKKLKERPPRILVNVKYHPYGAYKKVICNGIEYEYTRVYRSRLVVEAHMNNVDYDEFVTCLKDNEDVSSTFIYLPKDAEIHHLDENTLNDDISNLFVTNKVAHARIHSKTENFGVEYVKQVKISSIEDDAEEMTYDIQMETPANNFCANGIIVHNSGKSLSAKAFGTALGIPTLKLDIGSLFNSLVGESESRTRDALQLAEAMAPCVLWCDEVDKGLSGAQGSGANDSGVTRRVFGTLLSWMQEKKKPVFLVMTANQVDFLPPEFLRRGRFDELFAIDLPHQGEREQIAAVILKKLKRDPSKFNLKKIAEATEGYTGAEIEAVATESMFLAFDLGREVATEDLVAAAANIIPISKMMAEKIDAIRKWGEGRARPASINPQQQTASTTRKIKA